MDAAVAAVLGAGIGAGATIGATMLAARLQANHEAAKNFSHRRVEAYRVALRFLLRARNRRSGMTASGMTYVSKEDLGSFFEDLVDAQFSLAVLTTTCSAGQREALEEASQQLDTAVDSSIEGDAEGLLSITAELGEVYRIVLRAARKDIETAG